VNERSDSDNSNEILNVHPNVGMISLRRFRAELEVVPSTIWRWIQRDWLDRPINIGGRQYLSDVIVRRFKERAMRGEFAVSQKPPLRKSKKR
jgi:hypothetical protein